MMRLILLIYRCDRSLLVTGSLGVSGFQMMSRRSWRKYPKTKSRPRWSWPVIWCYCCLTRTTSRRWGRPARSSQRRNLFSMWLQRLQEQAGRPAGTENTDDLMRSEFLCHISGDGGILVIKHSQVWLLPPRVVDVCSWEMILSSP